MRRYDFGLLLYAAARFGLAADDLLAHMLALKDSAGMWAEYYDGGQPQKHALPSLGKRHQHGGRAAISSPITKGGYLDEYRTVFFPRAEEKPLDTLVGDGGLCGVFRTIGCVGDSLSSGEFESLDASGNKTYHDMFEYSWGQYLARMAGLTARNFSPRRHDRQGILRKLRRGKRLLEPPIWPARAISSRWV